MQIATRTNASTLLGVFLAMTLGSSATAQFGIDAGDIVEDMVRDQVEDAVRDQVEDAIGDGIADQFLGEDKKDEKARPAPAPQRSSPPRTQLVSSAEPDAVREAIAEVGTAELATDRDGAPIIAGRIEGVLYRVSFHGCESGDNCRHIVFSAGFADAEASLEDINSWNADQIFGVAFIDDAGLPRLKMSVNLEAGVAPANLDSTVERWRIALVEFRGYITR